MDEGESEYDNIWSLLSGISVPHGEYNFYYDETGNVRKFKLTDSGVNAEEGISNDFILGGVLFEGDTNPCDLETLFDALKINASEIKFKTLAGRKSDFWAAIGKKPVHTFLTWLESSGLYVHYATLNNIYYSVVDIVDSLIVAQPQFNFNEEWMFGLKASWYKFVVAHLDEVLPIFYKYSYPSVEKANIKSFCYELNDLILSYNKEDDFMLETFRQLLKTNGRMEELCFIEDNTPGLLVHEYSIVRVGRCAMYQNSMHYFDEESEAEASISKLFPALSGNIPKNYKFLDSKTEQLIQVSDVWVGLLGRLFLMLDQSTPDTIQSKVKSLTEKQKECIRIINSLLNKSVSLNPMLIQNLNSIEMLHHRGYLLELMNELAS